MAREIAARLELSGYRVDWQAFGFSTAFNTVIVFEILTGQLLILIALWGRETWIGVFCCGLLAALVLLFGPVNRAVHRGSLMPLAGGKLSLWSALCLRLGRRYSTANLVAVLPEVSEDAALPCLYLAAHYDSKSQRLPLAIRIALFILTLAGAGAFAVLGFLRLVFPALAPLATGVGIVVLLSGLPLLFFQDVGNASPGAIDNASGAGLVLHLAECFSRHPDWRDKLRVKILITGAEELAVMGAAAYVRAHLAALRRQAQRGGLYILNFDGVGVRGRLCFVGETEQGTRTRLLSLIRAACREMRLPLGRFNLVGALFDHLPFAEVGFDALSLVTLGRASWWVHTPQDSVEKLDVEGFRQAGAVALRVVEKLLPC